DGSDVGFVGVAGEVAHLHVLEHALAKRRHGTLRCGRSGEADGEAFPLPRPSASAAGGGIGKGRTQKSGECLGGGRCGEKGSSGEARAAQRYGEAVSFNCGYVVNHITSRRPWTQGRTRTPVARTGRRGAPSGRTRSQGPPAARRTPTPGRPGCWHRTD